MTVTTPKLNGALAEALHTIPPRMERSLAASYDAIGNRAGASVGSDDPPPPFSEDAIALSFSARHERDLRFVETFGRWMIYEGGVWRRDETLEGFDLVRDHCREIAATCDNEKVKDNISRAQFVYAVERLARADRRQAASADQWDKDDWLLNTPGGTINLRTGETRPHDPLDFCTKVTSVAPERREHPRFSAFLDRITAGDRDLQSYLQRLFGYALTGSTEEHAIFFGHGKGRNGKGALISTISGIMGGYHKVTDVETFTAQSMEGQHPTGLADLAGARLVTASETEENRAWAESRIKTLTGGDRIRARFMRRDFFEFTPRFKIVVTGNHRPSLRSVDDAIRARFHLIPFQVFIPEEERDPALPEKLREEWPAILQWMIDGCVEWQTERLRPPPIVLDATKRYLENEDAIAAWLEECIEVDPHQWETKAALFAAWREWARAAGEPPGKSKDFGDKLEAKGFVYHRKGFGRGYYGGRIHVQPALTDGAGYDD